MLHLSCRPGRSSAIAQAPACLRDGVDRGHFLVSGTVDYASSQPCAQSCFELR